MKQINIDEETFEYIKKKHLKYCKSVLKEAGKSISNNDCKLLFIEKPFDNDFNINSSYETKYKNKDKYDFRALYTAFRSPKGEMKKEWCASQFIEKLGVKICPYCGQQYFGLVPDKDTKEYKISEATLDHFLSKKKYPYLALNIYNLIPVCKTCNSTYKNQHSEVFLHPFFESLQDNINFNLNNLTIPNFLLNKDIDVHIKNVSESNIHQRVDDQIDRLRLKDRYKYYQDIIKSLIYKRIAFNHPYVQQLSNLLKLANINIEQMLLQQDIFGEDEPFMKFKSDIWKQIS